MKMPFYTLLGPLLRKNQKEISKICSHPALKIAPIYVGVLGTLGVVSVFANKISHSYFSFIRLFLRNIQFYLNI